MYVAKQLWQIMWHIPLAVLLMAIGLVLFLMYGMEGVDCFIINWGKTVDSIGKAHVTLPDESGYKYEGVGPNDG